MRLCWISYILQHRQSNFISNSRPRRPVPPTMFTFTTPTHFPYTYLQPSTHPLPTKHTTNHALNKSIPMLSFHQNTSFPKSYSLPLNLHPNLPPKSIPSHFPTAQANNLRKYRKLQPKKNLPPKNPLQISNVRHQHCCISYDTSRSTKHSKTQRPSSHFCRRHIRSAASLTLTSTTYSYLSKRRSVM